MSSPTSYLSSPVPSDAEWSQFLDAVVAAFDCVAGTLHAFDPQDQHLKLRAQRGVPPPVMPFILSIPLGKGIAGAAAARREPVEMCNLQTDESGVARPGAKQTDVKGNVVVPVMDGDRLCGTLGVGKMVPYDFTEAEKAQLTALGNEIAKRLCPVA